jgi:hypothetical protein
MTTIYSLNVGEVMDLIAELKTAQVHKEHVGGHLPDATALLLGRLVKARDEWLAAPLDDRPTADQMLGRMAVLLPKVELFTAGATLDDLIRGQTDEAKHFAGARNFRATMVALTDTLRDIRTWLDTRDDSDELRAYFVAKGIT